MGTGWSQEEGSQSQQSQEHNHSNGEPQFHGIGEKTTETQFNAENRSNNTQQKAADAMVSNTKSAVAAVEAVKLPHNYGEIMKDADSLPTEGISIDELYNQLCTTGIFLNKKRKKYWVEKKWNANCFMLFARELSITWADDDRLWNWPALHETSDVYVDIAELLNVCWLEVHRKFDTRNLSPGVLYEVVFVIMLKISAIGWEAPVNLRLTLPNGTKQEHKENFMTKPREQWIEVPVGEFKTSPENAGEIEIYIYEHEGGKWKRGLLIKGVAIRPKN